MDKDYWRNVDWEEEINACLQASLLSSIDDEECKAFRSTVGRSILLMQEHLPQKECHAILKRVNMPISLQICFQEYLQYIGRMVAANPQMQASNEHPNCRCVMPLDEMEDNNG